jgi:hypothetical protein
MEREMTEAFGRGEVATHTLLGLHTLVTPEGDVCLTLRYGGVMTPNEMEFQMTKRQAGTLVQVLVQTLQMAERPAPFTKQ